jgi:IMP and pyridine-specific 5'-nucleotidase
LIHLKSSRSFIKERRRMKRAVAIGDHNSFTPSRRNYILSSHRKDGLIEWMKEMLTHSFVLNAKETYKDTFLYFEELVEEYRRNPENSRLKELVPSVGKFHTPLALAHSFRVYDEKYSISLRTMIPPSVNEIRHILNLAQIISLGKNLKMICFDGDQTLYTDGGNFDIKNRELALSLIRLLCHGVKVVLVTAAGYGMDGASKYEYRLQELLNKFMDEQMNASQVENFYVLGGECHFLFQCKLITDTDGKTPSSAGTGTGTGKEKHKEEEQLSHIFSPPAHVIPTLDLVPPSPANNINESETNSEKNRERTEMGDTPEGEPEIPTNMATPTGGTKLKRKNVLHQRARLVAVPYEEWQAPTIKGPKPYYWPEEEVQEILNIAESTMNRTVTELKLRAKVLRKAKAVGVYPGGKEMAMKVAVGHGSRKLKQEALDEVVLRVGDAIRRRHHEKPFSIPYCVFNGGKDAWIDVGNKSVGVAALQGYFNLDSSESLHVGDQVSVFSVFSGDYFIENYFLFLFL